MADHALLKRSQDTSGKPVQLAGVEPVPNGYAALRSRED